MTDAVLYEVSGGIATLTLNEPDNRNALSRTLIAGLVARLDEALADPSVRAVVVTNNGHVFCAGADLSAPPSSTDEPSESMTSVLQRIMRAPKPMIARIAGHCSGGGVGLAAAFDISVAADDVKFGFTEARIGVSPAIISVVCLPKMRRADASEMFLRADRFLAGRAAEVGLINRAVPADELDAEIEAIVNDVVRGGPLALAACKQLIDEVPEMAVDDAFAFTTPFSMALFESDEAKAGIAAFRSREPAPWVPPERA